MSKNSWIILISTAIVITSIAIVLLLILTPQVQVATIGDEYEEVNKSNYTYEASKEDINTKFVEEYTVTSGKVKEGQKEQNYVPGNENPFTPEADAVKPNEQQVDPYKELTPADK